MKVLLLGEYSNVHWTLAQGLRRLGCDVTVVSNGDRFKNYNRDIDLTRRGYGVTNTTQYVYQLIKYFRKFKGYDVVQIINPFFLELKADKNLDAFRYLKKWNGKVFMGAFGDDAYWLRACLDKKTFRYSEFDVPGRNESLKSAECLIKVWSDKDKVRVNRIIAEESDGIIAGLYEYYFSYQSDFGGKLAYIPEPIDTSVIHFKQRGINPDQINFFIGIQKLRSEIKGTDIMYKVLEDIRNKYPDKCNIMKAESIPYSQYLDIVDKGDILLDQLYSYSPSMNALSAMAKGLVAVSGGEPEMYSLLGEEKNRPVINLIPAEEDIYNKLEWLVLNRNLIPDLSLNSRLFVEQHHDFIKIAGKYLKVWDEFSV